MNKGDYYKVVDKATKEIICAEPISFIKNTANMSILISFDNKYFFKFEGTMKYKVIENSKHLERPLKLEFLNRYAVCLYKDYFKYPHYDVYREFDITELDKPVIKLVKALNKFEGIETTGSYCGHDENILWIDIIFYTIPALNLLLEIINTEKYTDKFMLCNYYTQKNNSNESVMLRLRTFSIGEKAYKYADDLAKDLEEMYSLLYEL